MRRRRVGREVLYRLSGGDARALARGLRSEQRAAARVSKRKDAVVTYIITEPCIDMKGRRVVCGCLCGRVRSMRVTVCS